MFSLVQLQLNVFWCGIVDSKNAITNIEKGWFNKIKFFIVAVLSI